MISLYEGVPGAGKTCYVVQSKLLPWLRAGRRLYVRLNGFGYERLADLLGWDVQRLRDQVTLLETPDDIYSLWRTADPRAAVVIDEAQNYLRVMTKLTPEFLCWLEAHRHKGQDVVLIAQDYGRLTSAVLPLIETTHKFYRLWFLGLGNRYVCKVRGNPLEPEVIRTFTGRYDPMAFAFYDSYAVGAVKEESRGVSIWRSPKMVAIALVFVVGSSIFFARPWLSGATPLAVKDPRPGAEKGGTAGQGASLFVAPGASVTENNLGSVPAAAASSVLCIVGSWRVEDGSWRYMVSSGRSYSMEELTALSGFPVVTMEEGGVVRVLGQGLKHGPCESLTGRG